MAKDVKNQQLFIDLYVGTIMDVKKSITRPMCEYYNECKKNQQPFTKTICGYCNGCKKTCNYLQDLYVSITYLK
jgi:hypothetical protein